MTTNTDGRDAESVAKAYFEAWTANDSEAVRPLLHDNVDFVGALGTADGADACVSGLRGMFGMTKHVEVVRRWVDGEDVITWFELTTDAAEAVPIVNWSHVVDGRIDHIRVTFDPRPLIGG